MHWFPYDSTGFHEEVNSYCVSSCKWIEWRSTNYFHFPQKNTSLMPYALCEAHFILNWTIGNKLSHWMKHTPIATCVHFELLSSKTPRVRVWLNAKNYEIFPNPLTIFINNQQQKSMGHLFLVQTTYCFIQMTKIAFSFEEWHKESGYMNNSKKTILISQFGICLGDFSMKMCE